MILRRSALAAAIFLIISAAAPAAPGESLPAAIVHCSALPDDAAQLACYKQIAARLKADPGRASAPAPLAAAPAASDTAPGWFGRSDAPGPLDHIVDSIAGVTVSSFGHFTVTLKNGQVWRQLEGAAPPLHKGQTVIIKRGFLGGFHLSLQNDLGTYGSYAVKRID